MCGSCGLCLWECPLVCVWGPGSAFLGKSGTHGASVELCVCTHMPGFLGDTDVGLYRTYISGACVGLYSVCGGVLDLWLF